MDSSYILVTGATGLVGSHVVDNLVKRGHRVRLVVRSEEKARAFLTSRHKYRDQMDLFFIKDLTDPCAFDGAVQDVTGVIHIASPLNYSCENNEEAPIISAIQGVRSIMQASLSSDTVRRVVLTSSFGAVLDMARPEETLWTYTHRDWNPVTYAEATAPSATPQDAYRGSKTFAEQEAWKFMEQEKPHFDLVTLCPFMVFGPLSSPPSGVGDLNESNKMLWKVLSSAQPGADQVQLPPCRFNFWIDVRDLAEIHVRALMTPAAGRKRYIPVSPEAFTYQRASEIMQDGFPTMKGKLVTGVQTVKTHVAVHVAPLERDMPGLEFTPFEKTVMDFSKQLATLLS